MKFYIKKYVYFSICLLFLIIFVNFKISKAEVIHVDANSLLPKVDVSFSPRTGSFVEGSTFEVPIIINTKNSNINGVEIKLNYDKDRLSIVKPSSGKSIIGIWVEPPKYDNTKGVASYVGVIPEGITTMSGLVGTITFKAIRTGNAIISIGSDSKILLNDGLGTEAISNWGRAEYTILTKAPEGVRIFSETHPVQDDWYNNNNPVLSWERDPGVDGFSYVLDNKFSTIPDNNININDTSKSFENLKDGLWYFHIKAHKNGAWGNAGHFLIKIDKTPPAGFKPEVDYLMAAAVLTQRTLISFFTTDNLSGIDHYEVGVIDKNQPLTESPVFIQSESPFQVPIKNGSNLEVIVRAIDKAGNIKDESIAVKQNFSLLSFVKDNLIYILLFIILIIYIANRYFNKKFKIVIKNEIDTKDSGPKNTENKPENKVSNDQSVFRNINTDLH